MIVTFKARPSKIHVGRWIVLDTRTVNISECEHIRVEAGPDIRTFVPIKTKEKSPCLECSFSSRHNDRLMGVCTNIFGCGRHMMCFKASEEVLEEL